MSTKKFTFGVTLVHEIGVYESEKEKARCHLKMKRRGAEKLACVEKLEEESLSMAHFPGSPSYYYSSVSDLNPMDDDETWEVVDDEEVSTPVTPTKSSWSIVNFFHFTK